MRYAGLPRAMWIVFAGSFRKHLVDVLGYDKSQAKRIASDAHANYRAIIEGLPEFDRRDRFKMNIVNCAMLCAFLDAMDRRPSLEMLSYYYESAMMTPAMKVFCRASGRNKFSEKDLAAMRAAAELKPADTNPYSWNMDLFEYEDGSGYEARFYTCGICTLMKERGYSALVPAMCRLDYAMSEAGGASMFVREHTLASGGPHCDCGYKKRGA
jgi:hypothetical protein